MNTQLLPGAAGRIAVEDVGWEGVPVVAVHGAGGNASQWNALQKALRPRRFVTIDLRGHGRSDTPSDRRFDPAAMADDLGLVIDSLGLPRVVLVGHAAGAAVVTEWAARAPERIAGVCLVAPRPLPLPDDLTAAFSALAGPMLQERIRRELARTPEGHARAVFAAHLDWTAPPRSSTLIELTSGPHWLHITSPNVVATAILGLSPA